MNFILNNKNYILIIFITAFIILNLFLLSYSPLPWFDEVFFASVTHSFLNNGNFHLTISPLFNEREVLAYGPVYFFMTAFSIKLLGWGIFQFRIINFLFSVANIFMSALLLKRHIKNKSQILIFIAVFSVDTMFTINSHSGRMDGVALFFVLSTIFYISKENKIVKDFGLSGLFSVLAILTTPRAVFFIIPAIIIYSFTEIKHIKEKSSILKLLSLITLPVIFYFTWIFLKFGSLSAFFDFYLVGNNENFNNKSLLESFIAFRPYIKNFEYPLVIITTIFTVFLFIKQRIKKDKIILVSIFNILIFYIFILDTGMYSIFIIPFLYILLFISINSIKLPKYVKKATLIIILVFNLSLFFIKTTAVSYDYAFRQYSSVDKIVKNTIPENSKVIGNDMYFYSLIKNNCNFQTIERGESINERCNYHYNQFNFEYLIISDAFSESNGIAQIYLNKEDLELIKHIRINTNKKSLTVFVAKILDIPVPYYSYEGTIYKRKKINELN